MKTFTYNFYIVLSLVGCIHLLGTSAYPILNVRRLFDAAIDGRYKKSELTLPQTDKDVIELEHLKQNSDDIKNTGAGGANDMPISVDESGSASEESSISRSDDTQEHDLTTSTTKAPVAPNNVGGSQSQGEPAPEATESDGTSQHRPPTLQHHDGGKIPSNQNADAGESANGAGPVPSMTKPFYGAARLAFGQNPEVLPTAASTSTTTAIPHTTSESIQEAVTTAATTPHNVATSSLPIPGDSASHSHPTDNTDQEHLPISLESDGISRQINKEELQEGSLTGSKKTESRRSVTLMPPKAAESLFKHKDGQYSSFDMAQYVFWTGDESGVARAVEEFIQQGLMSRESAISFLRDIRLGIEYLQNSYANRMFPNEFRGNNIKKTFDSTVLESIGHNEGRAAVLPSAPSLTTTTRKPITLIKTTEKPFPRVHLERTDGRKNIHLQKTLEGIPSLMRFHEMSNERKQNKDLSESDESAGKAKLAEFLYTEYTLEEVIYQMAKVMFSQSLEHGSERSQKQLQKFVEYLEEEGKRGSISIGLQKQILDVLLSALSDTLLENPELLASARLNLGSTFHKIPTNSLDEIKNKQIK